MSRVTSCHLRDNKPDTDQRGSRFVPFRLKASHPTVISEGTWLWVKNMYPKWTPGKWKYGPKPAVPWWFNFDPDPSGRSPREVPMRCPGQLSNSRFLVQVDPPNNANLPSFNPFCSILPPTQINRFWTIPTKRSREHVWHMFGIVSSVKGTHVDCRASQRQTHSSAGTTSRGDAKTKLVPLYD